MREITWSVKRVLNLLLQSFSWTSISPYWTAKVENIVAFTVIFSNICTAHAQKRLFMNFRCKIRHRRSTRRARFPFRVQNFGDLATFSVDFYILYSECPPYFYFRFVWLTHLKSIPHASTPTLIIPTTFEVYRTIHCRDTAFSVDFCSLYAECPPYFYFRIVWPTDLESILHASIPTSIIATKFEDPTSIRSWVMSYNVSHWLPLKMRTRPLRMHRITWPVSRGSKTITFLESPTPICLFTIQHLLGYDDD